jgi:hypothetical protein
MQYAWIVLSICVCKERGNAKGPRMKSSHASKESFVKKFIFQSNYDVKIILIFSVSWRLLAIHLRRIQKEVNYIFAVKHYVEV